LDGLEPNDFYRHALYLLVKLFANTNVLPTSLFVQGVDIGSVRDPSRGGVFADIYRGHHNGIEVAVKMLRFFSEEPRVHAHRVSRRFSSRYTSRLILPSQAFCKQALVWRQLAHPNVLPFIGVDAKTFANINFPCMVSPWMSNGSLLEYIRSDNYKPAEDTHRIVCLRSTGFAGSD
jgi:serine/threonine protein kinase